MVIQILFVVPFSVQSVAVFLKQGYGVLAAVASATKAEPVISLRERSYALQFTPRAAVIKVDYSKFRTAEQMVAATKIQYAAISNSKHVGLTDFKDHPIQPPAPHKA